MKVSNISSKWKNLTTLYREQSFSKPELILLLSGLTVFLLHCISVGYYPMCWNDEVEIIEIGRRALFPNEDWSVYLSPQPDGGYALPFPLLHYLAASIQELLYRISGGFTLPRLFFLSSLPACAFALFRWLSLKKDIAPNCSLFISLLFLVDPNATICAHWYRPDLWAMTLLFVALVQVDKKRFMTAGAISAFMVFFWITSALFLPLVFIESLNSSENKWRDFRRATIGAIIAVIIILIPLYSRLPGIISQYANHSELGNSSSRGFAIERLVDFIKIAVRSPFVWLLAIVGMVRCKRRFAHLTVFLSLVVFMLWSRVYHLRMVYLMPYLFLFAAILLSGVAARIRKYIQCLSITAYTAVSIVILECAALPIGDNTLSNLMDRLKANTPSNTSKVYLIDNEHELYLACRKLGWKMYSSWSPSSAFDESFVGDLITQMDAVIAVDSSRFRPSETNDRYLKEHGFTRTSAIRFQRSASGIRKLLVDFFYTYGYPDLVVYTR